MRKTDSTESTNLVLRADVFHLGRGIVAHTVEISESSVFVETDHVAEVGDPVLLVLSFPGLLEPITFETVVVSTRGARGVGDPGGIDLGFAFRSPDQRARLVALLTRATAGTDREADDAPYRVLLVDDNRLTREVFEYGVKKYFRDRESVIVDVAQDGQQAWDLLGAHRYDLAIIDQYLPVMNGDLLIGHIRNSPATASLPIIAISVGGDDARDATLAAGANLFLAKPVVIRSLFSTLAHLTSHLGV